MANVPITQFNVVIPIPSPFQECMDNYDVGTADAEWPNNMISRNAVLYESGKIAPQGVRLRHNVDADELALCRALAKDVAGMMSGVEVGMGSESTDLFYGFFIIANLDDPARSVIDAELVRSQFGGTLFPLATITAEPLSEHGIWWSEVEEDGSESGPDYFRPWRAMIRWFQQQPEFVATSFVRIGDRDALWHIPRSSLPQGTVAVPCVLPRLALGLTKQGSLVGLFGVSVQT